MSVIVDRAIDELKRFKKQKAQHEEVSFLLVMQGTHIYDEIAEIDRFFAFVIPWQENVIDSLKRCEP